MISVNAKLFRIASMFSAKKTARLYLCGVQIEKAEDGVLLVAADGHRLIVINDKEGTCEKNSLIVKTTKHFLDATKKTKDELKERIINVTSEGTATILKNDPIKAIVQYNDFVIDGDFPVWKRVVPWKLKKTSPAGYNYKYLNDFGKAAKELSGSDCISIKGTENGAAIVRFSGCDYAFGVLMPVNFGDMEIPESLQYLKSYK